MHFSVCGEGLHEDVVDFDSLRCSPIRRAGIGKQRSTAVHLGEGHISARIGTILLQRKWKPKIGKGRPNRNMSAQFWVQFIVAVITIFAPVISAVLLPAKTLKLICASLFVALCVV